MWEEPNQDLQIEQEGGRTNLLCKSEGQGRIFQSGMSCFCETSLSFPLPSRLFTLVLYLFRPQKSTATVAQVPKESLSLHLLYLPSASSPLFLSDFQYLSGFFSSAASSKCLQITQLWNLYFSLYVYLDKLSFELRFFVQQLTNNSLNLIFWKFSVVKSGKIALMVMPGHMYSTGRICNPKMRFKLDFKAFIHYLTT